MFQFLTFIVDTVNTFVHFLLNIVVSLVNFIRLIPTFTTYTISLFAWLPQPFALFAILGLSSSVLLYIIGRQT